MTPAVVIGNGASRGRFDLTAIPHTTYGCNGLIETFRPTYLMFNDRWSRERMAMGDYEYTKPPKEADIYAYGSCGAAALRSSLFMGHGPVYLVGFDGGLAHACPDFGMGGPKTEVHNLWLGGFKIVLREFPDAEVSLVGPGKCYLDVLFPRVHKAPWLR